MGEMAILDRVEGDIKTIWDPENEEETAQAKRQFDDMRKKGYLAYTVTDKGRKGEQIREFDPDAGRIILAPPLRGG